MKNLFSLICFWFYLEVIRWRKIHLQGFALDTNKSHGFLCFWDGNKIKDLQGQAQVKIQAQT